jgi:DNA-binding NarL/FixJ family response regulator
MSNKRVLVVDDEKLVRQMISDYLERDYTVITEDNAENALLRNDLDTFDLVISDINMPGIPGYEFLSEVKKKHPKVRTALITAYDVDDYVRMAKENGITNIIAKTVPFNFAELGSIVRGLITGDIFGLERHMKPGYKILKEYEIRGSADAKSVREDALKTLQAEVGSTGELRLVLDEVVTNALYHSVRDESGAEKYREFAQVELLPHENFTLTCAIDDEKYAVFISDKQGTLTKDIVLYKIDRHIRGEGVLDDSGRGLFMSRIFADRFIVNIDPGKKTEIVIINYRTPVYHGFKPLYINEL